MDDLAPHILAVKRRIRAAETDYGRPAGAVKLLAVSKTKPAAMIRSAAALGLHRFGENYVQEALEKMRELSDLDLEWHYIGPIQSNKTRAIAEHFDWAHSVDRLKHARRLNQQRPRQLPQLNICLQVNISAEPSKAGVAPGDLPALARSVRELPRLRLRGLMAIPAPQSEFSRQRDSFAILRTLQEALCADGLPLDTLSMGMSADLEAAIAEGSTLVRIGTALFGARSGASTA